MAGERTSQPFAPAMEARARLASVREDLKNARITALVVGAGKSGLAAARLLRKCGAHVRLADDRDPKELARIPELSGPGAPALVKASPGAFDKADLVVLSPGFPRSRPELAPAIERGILVSEIELASWFVKAPIVGITGTNGKSTTTALVGHLFESGGRRTFAGGNLGVPLSELASDQIDGKPPVDVAVVELSSYQLESIVDITFEVACWLNLTPDHADRYPDIETYGLAKQRIVERRSANGIAVLNAKDRFCADAGIRIGGPIRWFAADVSSDLAGPMGTLLTGADSAVRTIEGAEERYDLRNDALPGMHNRANMIAAIECARHLGVTPDAVQRGLRTFKGLPHRIELIRTIGDLRFYNDSKATNIDSAVIALRALREPKILIAGGKDKGAPWTPLREIAKETGVKAVLAIGAAAPIVLAAFSGVVSIVEDTKTLEGAILRARQIASPGDAVLLSPACASFDQFKNYEHRGDTFRSIVQALEEEEGAR
jgi:UDP-N-acetylmuramoylalanine--D-glutamate ligase